MFDDLELPPQALTHVEPAAHAHRRGRRRASCCRARRRTAHKGQQGSVLVIGGGIGMAGAARMAGEAALRAGAGLVTVATRTENVAAIVGARPELMCRGVDERRGADGADRARRRLALGPGLGQDDWAQTLFDTALGSDKPHGRSTPTR